MTPGGPWEETCGSLLHPNHLSYLPGRSVVGFRGEHKESQMGVAWDAGEREGLEQRHRSFGGSEA